MTVLLHSGSFPVTPALQEYAERQLKTVLDKFGDRVERIMVRMDDVNGPRGGSDKRCGVTVSLARHRQLFVEETAGDAYTALAQAIKRVARTIAREVQRWNSSKSGKSARRTAGKFQGA